MKYLKKLIGVTLAAMMIVSLVPVNSLAKAADGDEAIVYFESATETTNQSYPLLSEAIDAANASTETTNTIYLLDDAAISGYAYLGANVTLVIPTSDDYQKDGTTGGSNVNSDGDPNGTAFRTLTVEDDAYFDINGTLIVAGNQQGSQSRTGFRTGAYGELILGNNASLVIEGDANLYARGDITGSGTISAESGSTVYQRFQIADWRGGTASRSAYQADVFPFNLYSLGGISVPTTYHAGSSLNGQAYITVFGIGQNVTVPYISKTADGKAPIGFSDPAKGEIVFSKDGDLTKIDVNGASAVTGNLSFSAFGYTFESEGLVCPFGYNTSVNLNNGTVLDVETMLKILPGCTVNVGTGAELNIKDAGAVYFYAANTYKDTYYFYRASATMPLDWNYNAAASLTVADGGKVTTTGTIANSSEDFTNVAGFEPKTDEEGAYVTVTVKEYTTSAQNVPFYVGTPKDPETAA